MADENVEGLAVAVEDWKQLKYFFRRLVKSIEREGVDLEAFRDEFVEEENARDRELIELVGSFVDGDAVDRDG